MFDDLKNLPDAQKKLLRRTVTMTSAMFLIIAALMWAFKEKAMEVFGIDSGSVDLIAGILCAMVVIDLVFVKSIIGEDKAK